MSHLRQEHLDSNYTIYGQTGQIDDKIAIARPRWVAMPRGMIIE